MTRQQDAERRLVDDLAYAWMTSTIPPMGEDIARLIVQRIGKAIAADPSLMAAFEPEPATPPAYVERVITDPQPWGGRQTGRQSGQDIAESHDVARAIGQPPY